MLYIWDIERIIEGTLKEHKLNIKYEFNNKLTAPMSYNVSINTIKFNYLKINGYISIMKVQVKETDENLVKIILYHELGYYLDFKKNKHDLRILMYGDEEEKERLKSEIETNAWEYGRTLVPQQLLESYDKVRELNKILVKGIE
ncbi:hypothetical protein R4Z09_14090 [Niallia oryzisoli]|uniref:Uncharacterized protein n=1 Tax=Niallia oryzisoli TaxID=1737571 RepID=A0ABZ2CLP7_9BACI